MRRGTMGGLTKRGKSSRGGIIKEQLWNRAETGKNRKQRKETQNHAPDGRVGGNVLA